ncbi:ATP-binding protein [Ponticaulis sp.]|uniref:sensor histidine kinase n=1 Tax=Ponticaulis sp. TaxID=2020902 RepID=UPI000B6C5C33|nr:HAMP domain-containing sensor histidine kinase [Ponticaulis sp.]MAI90518.1 hypothetical protein [Ponticaulis sp.]OUY00212.1 MAG: hypothetical protein CBB65_08775 [Hyphomonadaceae bacterium TMED5]|tara:strand:+ start:146743 stop:147510 length:768 start_codon:yes stop_codon:yes gene_type:complete
MKKPFVFDQADSGELLAEVASVIAHDVRTPVRHVGQFLEFYERELLAGNIKQAAAHMEVVKESLGLVSDMLDGVITYARMGRGLEAPEEVNLHKLVNSALERAQMASGQRDVKLVFEGNEFGFGHEVRLMEMFYHLFENALLYHPGDSKPEIRVRVCRAGDQQKIEISDSGKGLPEGYSDIVFDLFQQVEKGKAHQGIGLGMSMARRIAQMHGGDILLAEKQPGPDDLSGLKLIVLLPIAEKQREMAERLSASDA